MLGENKLENCLRKIGKFVVELIEELIERCEKLEN